MRIPRELFQEITVPAASGINPSEPADLEAEALKDQDPALATGAAPGLGQETGIKGQPIAAVTPEQAVSPAARATSPTVPASAASSATTPSSEGVQKDAETDAVASPTAPTPSVTATVPSGQKTPEEEAEAKLKDLAQLIARKAGEELDAEDAENMLRKFRDENPTDYEKLLKAQEEDKEDENTVHADASNPEGVFIKYQGLDFFLERERERIVKIEEFTEKQEEKAGEALLEENAKEFAEERDAAAEENAEMRDSMTDPAIELDPEKLRLAAEAQKALEEDKDKEQDNEAKADTTSTPTPKPGKGKRDAEADSEIKQDKTAGLSKKPKLGSAAEAADSGATDEAAAAAADRARTSFVEAVGPAADAVGADEGQEADAVAAMAAAGARSPTPVATSTGSSQRAAPRGAAAASPFSGAAEMAKEDMEKDLAQRLHESGMSGELAEGPRPQGAVGT